MAKTNKRPPRSAAISTIESWVTSHDAAFLEGLSKKTITRKCQTGQLNFKTFRGNGGLQSTVALSTLSAKAREKYARLIFPEAHQRDSVCSKSCETIPEDIKLSLCTMAIQHSGFSLHNILDVCRSGRVRRVIAEQLLNRTTELPAE